jgi:hypothetical protein
MMMMEFNCNCVFFVLVLEMDKFLLLCTFFCFAITKQNLLQGMDWQQWLHFAWPQSVSRMVGGHNCLNKALGPN